MLLRTRSTPSSSEQALQAVCNVVVFAMNYTLVAVHDGDLAAESTHRLRELQPDISGAENDQVLGNDIELQRLDVSQWLCCRQSWNLLNDCACVPVPITTLFPRSNRFIPFGNVASIVLGPTNLPVAMINSAPLCL